MWTKKQQYSSIDEEDSAGKSPAIADEWTEKKAKLSALSFCTSWSIVLLLLVTNIHTWRVYRSIIPNSAVYSPATPAVRYKNVVGTSGVLGHNSPFQGDRNAENDEAWESLYNFGISRIPMSEAALLVNRTWPIAKDPGYYAITLDVFHQLHCLNMIRKRVWSRDDFDTLEKGDFNSIHIDHCIDSIRQSLMCSGDITPMPYIWYRQFQSALPATGMMRTCRDFEALQTWAKERQSHVFNTSLWADDPLGNVIYEALEGQQNE